MNKTSLALLLVILATFLPPATASRAAEPTETRLATVAGRVYALAADDEWAAWGVVTSRPAPPLPTPPRPPGPPNPPAPPAPPIEEATIYAARLGTGGLTNAVAVATGLPPGTPFAIGSGRLAFTAPAGQGYVLRLYSLADGRSLPPSGEPAWWAKPAIGGEWLVWGAPTSTGGAINALHLGNGERRILGSFNDPDRGAIAKPLLLAADKSGVAWVAPDSAGLQWYYYSFAQGVATRLTALERGTAPTRLFVRGGELLWEQPADGQVGASVMLTARGDQARQTIATIATGSLAVSSDLLAWLPPPTASGTPAVQAYDALARLQLPRPLTPATARPSGPMALTGSRLLWADSRDPGGTAIYSLNLADAGVVGALFRAKWQSSDGPTAAGAAKRAWVWGPDAAGFADRAEPYDGDSRSVRYYDKARMELNKAADGSTYLTNGLLVVEMIAGQMQVGANQYERRAPSDGPVAGDSSRDTPNYAALSRVASLRGDNRADDRRGRPVTDSLDHDGHVAQITVAGSPVSLSAYEPATGHNVADVFAAYLARGGAADSAAPRLFDPLAAVGYPITEPYWISIRAAGQERLVLMQAFQRRVLTYSPGNPPGWQVEMGNVGRHYFAWRYFSTGN